MAGLRSQGLLLPGMSRRSKRSAGATSLDTSSDALWEVDMRARGDVQLPEQVALPAGSRYVLCCVRIYYAQSVPWLYILLPVARCFTVYIRSAPSY